MKTLRPLILDFQKNHRRPAWPNFALLLTGVATTVYLAIHSANTFSEIGMLEAEQTVFERKYEDSSADSKLSASDRQHLRVEIKQANEVLAQLSLPWEKLFRDIEYSPGDPIALLAIEPDTKKRLITITGEAKNLDAMLSYVRSLQNKKSLNRVYLRNHRIEQKMSEQPVRFVVVASWVTKS